MGTRPFAASENDRKIKGMGVPAREGKDEGHLNLQHPILRVSDSVLLEEEFIPCLELWSPESSTTDLLSPPPSH